MLKGKIFKLKFQRELDVKNCDIIFHPVSLQGTLFYNSDR